jgi:hypothetical protein
MESKSSSRVAKNQKNLFGHLLEWRKPNAQALQAVATAFAETYFLGRLLESCFMR